MRFLFRSEASCVSLECIGSIPGKYGSLAIVNRFGSREFTEITI